MSTRLTSLVSLTALGMLGLCHTAFAQGGGHPVKLTGSSQVVVDNGSRLMSYSPRLLTTIYYYTVELNQTSTSDTTVYLSNTTGALYHPLSVVVLAGHLTKSFPMFGLFAPSSDALTAYNAYGSVSMDVDTVTP